MTEDSEVPSDSSLDVIASIQIRSALYVFRLNITRIRELLRAGVEGINSSKKMLKSISTKIAQSIKNPVTESEHKQSKTARTGRGTTLVKLSGEQITLLQEVITWNSNIVANLHFQLHNVLCVAAWGAFEGYIQSALAELFSRNTSLLTSDKKISVSEVLTAGDGITDYLVAREIDDVGRKSFDDLQAYLKTRLQIQFSNEYAKLLREAYFLRNVIAHSAGYVRKDQLNMVPKGVEIKNGEINIEDVYLAGVLDSIVGAVSQFDAQLRARFGASHKPTLDEMGPHAMLPPKGAPRPTQTIDVPTEAEKKGRRGRPRKTRRPGQ